MGGGQILARGLFENSTERGPTEADFVTGGHG